MSDDGIRLIVGLGNPGSQYEATRHNAGFWFVDRVADRHGGAFRAEAKFHGLLGRVTVGGQDLRLLKPQTFMNRSGQSIAAVARYFDIPASRILVAYDELDLPVGRVRLKQGGGHAGHNGMRDTLAVLASPELWRLRVGIDHPGDKSQVVGYVLSRPTKADHAATLAALDDAVEILPELVAGKFQLAMNRLHGGR